MTRSKLGILSKEKYDTLHAKLSGTFRIAEKARSDEQARALFLFKRWRDHLAINRHGKITFNGRLVVKNSEVNAVIKNEFKSNFGMGYRSLYYKLKNKYCGIPERKIKKYWKLVKVIKGSSPDS